MCGICVLCQFNQSITADTCDPLGRSSTNAYLWENSWVAKSGEPDSYVPLKYDAIKRRGPDNVHSGVATMGCEVASKRGEGGTGGFLVEWMQSVLRMRTEKRASQEMAGCDGHNLDAITPSTMDGRPRHSKPVELSSSPGCQSTFVLYNGEIYAGLADEEDSVHGCSNWWNTDVHNCGINACNDPRPTMSDHSLKTNPNGRPSHSAADCRDDSILSESCNEVTQSLNSALSTGKDSSLSRQQACGCECELNCWNNCCSRTSRRSKLHCYCDRESMNSSKSSVSLDFSDKDDSLSRTPASCNWDVHAGSQHSDTDEVTQLLKNAGGADEIMQIIQRFKGPYAIVVVQPAASRIWFVVDVFGRRSLLANVGCPDRLVLSSVAFSDPARQITLDGFVTVPSGVLFCARFGRAGGAFGFQLYGYPFRQFPEGLTEFCVQFRDSRLDDRFVAGASSSNYFSSFYHICDEVGISNKPCSYPYADNPSLLMNALLQSNEDLVVQFLCHLRRAVGRRIADWSTPAGDSIAVLFSGGVDSLLIAALIGQLLPAHRAIRLVNVVFYDDVKTDEFGIEIKKRCGQSRIEPPDRLTGRAAFDELANLFPPPIHCQFYFTPVDVPASEVAGVERDRMDFLLRPGHTGIIDRSLGVCLWFAASGKGLDNSGSGRFNKGNCAETSTPVKALLTGAGADELLGGYARHRSRFKTGGRLAVLRELEMEVRRIGARNLARDDRIVADHGREIRTPFLDEDFVKFVNGLTLEQKCDFSLPVGIGEKLLLRLALWKLGFRTAALTPKRAFQFGSGVAKLQKLRICKS